MKISEMIDIVGNFVAGILIVATVPIWIIPWGCSKLIDEMLE